MTSNGRQGGVFSAFKLGPAIGHRVSRSVYRGSSPVGKAFRMTIRGQRDGNGQSTLPTVLPTGATSELSVERDGGTLRTR